MSKKRKTYNPAEKAKIVLEALREERTLNEIATNYGVSPQLRLYNNLDPVFSLTSE